VTPSVPTHTFSFNGVTTTVYHAQVGEGLSKHSHKIPHITFVARGSTIVRKEGKELVMTPETQPVLLPATEWHEIEALEDNTVFINII
jgi:quercetin dioxygenase-like cupin family protein